MVAINQEDILGTLIPDVFISQIVLESSGTPVVDNNPHIDTASEKTLSLRESNDNLVVTIRLMIKDKISNDLISSWVDKLDIQKYLRIQIFQSTDAKSTAFLSLSQDMLEVIDDEKAISSNDKRLKVASSIYENDNLEFIFEKFKNTIKSQVINVNRKQKTDKLIDENNNEISNINYTIKFVVNNSFPEHLAYFVKTSFDVVKLAQDFNLEYDTVSLDKMNGKVVSDIVIDEGDIVDRSYVFLDPNGNIWAGAVHLGQNNQWRSKSREEEGSVNLSLEIIANSKIQDFRNVKDIQKLQFDFSNINTKLGQIEIKMMRNDKIDPKRLDEYFSDFSIAMDRNGDSKFFFSVNYEKLITDFSLYGGLIKKGGSRFVQEMMTKTKIKEMKILRRRVKIDSTINRFGVSTGLKRFDPNEADEVVCVAGEKSFGRFVTNNNVKGALREVEIVLDQNNSGIRHFTGMDKIMSEITDGLYQYGVEMDIVDGSLEFFKERIADLAEAKSDLVAYYNEASKLPLSKFIAEVQDPHIQHPSETAGTSTKLMGNFDFDSNKFTKKFINLMTSKYSGRNLPSAPWIAPITIYADVLDMFTDAFKSRRDRGIVLNSLFTYVSPKTGNPSGILAVIKLMDNLIGTIESIVKTGESKGPKKSKSKINKAILYNGQNHKKSFKVEKFFNSYFNSNQIRGVGMDYLSHGHDDTRNDNGLKVISGDDFNRRINSETLRFFNSTDSDLNLKFANQTISKDRLSNTSFSFLAPARIDLPRKSISLLDQIDIPNSKSKKNRVLENINDGTDSRRNKYSQLHSTILMQNLTKKPIASMFDSFGSKGKAQGNGSVEAVSEMLTNVLSEYGSVLVQPVDLSEDEDDEGVKILKPIRPEKLTSLVNIVQPVDLTPASSIPKKEPTKDVGGTNIFMRELTQGLTQNGVPGIRITENVNIYPDQPFSRKKDERDLKEKLDTTKLEIIPTEDRKDDDDSLVKSEKVHKTSGVRSVIPVKPKLEQIPKDEIGTVNTELEPQVDITKIKTLPTSPTGIPATTGPGTSQPGGGGGGPGPVTGGGFGFGT